ncbi:ribosomal RNA small subunit methyltransferase A [Candidatus Uhrbacteria bacterium]|nr:ribosomal RNA small subunit methyltransferase A [Candidatus Uhrbacteria bacterium]
MSILSSKRIKELVAELGISPQKTLGQNFLIDENILQKIISVAELTDKDTILEIGPGLGILTKELAVRAGKVIAIEKDKKLVHYLQSAMKSPPRQDPAFSALNFKEAAGQYNNITIVEEDFLKIDLSKLGLGKSYKIVANLPYSITSDAIRKIMESDPAPSAAVLMVQKEVAERICAKPGDMSLLALSVQYYGVPSLMFQVSRGSFWPVPKVDSAVIKILIDKKRDLKVAEDFFRIARIGFSSPRKQLQNNLSSGLHTSKEKTIELLNRAKINPKARPEELGVGDWERLAQMD